MTPCQKLLIEARFLSYIIRLPNGCMIWTGGRSKGGKGKEGRKARGGPYGSFRVDQKIGPKRAHIVWAWLTGRLEAPTVPEGFQLDHHCDSGTLCVCCTTLLPKAVNLSLSRTRPKRGADGGEARARADAARRNRRRRLARKRKTGDPKTSRAAK